MKLYAPSYYKEFKCIADKCRHSCCAGWEISVDEKTFEKYSRLPLREREAILSHIDDGVIGLDGEGRCPFLDERGLCRIISKYGEEYTSEICREHPRFYNFLSGRAEVGIGASCEEAARIILNSESYYDIVPIGDVEDVSEKDFDPVPDRSFIYELLKKKDISYRKKLDRIKTKYYLPDEIFLPGSLSEKLSELEYLRQEDKSIFCAALSEYNEEDATYCERFLAYLLYRHLGEASSFDNMRARVCLCILLGMLFASLLTTKIDKVEAARLISEEIEYSEDNIDSLIFDFECDL